MRPTLLPHCALLIAAVFAAPTYAKLAPPTPEQKAVSDEAAAKTAWGDKTSAYQLCRASERVAEKYRADAKAAGKTPPAPTATPPCTDPGPYQSPVIAAGPKPIEAAGAHSPPSAATSPPNTATPQANMKK